MGSQFGEDLFRKEQDHRLQRTKYHNDHPHLAILTDLSKLPNGKISLKTGFTDVDMAVVLIKKENSSRLHLHN